MPNFRILWKVIRLKSWENSSFLLVLLRSLVLHHIRQLKIILLKMMPNRLIWADMVNEFTVYPAVKLANWLLIMIRITVPGILKKLASTWKVTCWCHPILDEMVWLHRQHIGQAALFHSISLDILVNFTNKHFVFFYFDLKSDGDHYAIEFLFLIRCKWNGSHWACH